MRENLPSLKMYTSREVEHFMLNVQSHASWLPARLRSLHRCCRREQEYVLIGLARVSPTATPALPNRHQEQERHFRRQEVRCVRVRDSIFDTYTFRCVSLFSLWALPGLRWDNHS